MNTSLEGAGPLRNRFELGAHFDFGIVDSDENRVYCGPDFYGTGQPYGLFVEANYYSPGWQADLRTWNQVLPDGETQVYSSVLHDGWAVCAVFNGIYKRTFDHKTNPETQKFVDDWIALETQRGSRPQVLPTKEKGAWTGELFVNAGRPERRRQGAGHHRARPAVAAPRAPADHVERCLERSYGFERLRDGARTQYEGPEVFGNATSYGRALFTTPAPHGRRLAWRGEDPRPRGAHRRRHPRARGRLAADAAARPPRTSCTACSPGRPRDAAHRPGRRHHRRHPRDRPRPGPRAARPGLPRRRSAVAPRPASTPAIAELGGRSDRSPASPPTSRRATPCRRCGTTRSRRSAGSTSGSTTRASPRRAGRCRRSPRRPSRTVVATNLFGATNGSVVAMAGLQAAAGRRLDLEHGGLRLHRPGAARDGGVRRHQAGGHLPDRVAGQGDQGQQRQGRLPVAGHRRDRPADRRLRRPARGVREGPQDLQHPR